MKIKYCKLKEVLSCDKYENIVEVAKILREKRQRHMIVTDNKKPIGIISTTDINNRLVAENKNPMKTKAEEIMTAPILTKDINENLTQAYIEMIKENIFSVPITENEKLKGTLELKEAMEKLVKAGE